MKRKEMRSRAGRGQERPVSRRKVQEARRQETRQKRGVPEEGFLQAEQEQEERFQEERYSEAAHYIEETETELPINIEGEPRNVENGEKRRSPAERRVSRETDGNGWPALKEAAEFGRSWRNFWHDRVWRQCARENTTVFHFVHLRYAYRSKKQGSGNVRVTDKPADEYE